MYYGCLDREICVEKHNVYFTKYFMSYDILKTRTAIVRNLCAILIYFIPDPVFWFKGQGNVYDYHLLCALKRSVQILSIFWIVGNSAIPAKCFIRYQGCAQV